MKLIITENQFLNLTQIDSSVYEARSNPDTNVNETFDMFFKKLLSKYPIYQIFLSFRDDLHVTDVNAQNRYDTPTGFYTYPLISYNDEIRRYVIDDKTKEYDENQFRQLFPYQNELKYMVFFVLKNKEGVLDAETPKNQLDGYVQKIKELYLANFGGENGLSKQFDLAHKEVDIAQTNLYNAQAANKRNLKGGDYNIFTNLRNAEAELAQKKAVFNKFNSANNVIYYCDRFIENKYVSDKVTSPVHETHKFWLFLYDIALFSLQKVQTNNNVTNYINILCRRIGVNGFVDYEGYGYIHTNEKKQAVFFKTKNIGEIFTYELKSLKLKDFNGSNNEEGRYISLGEGLYAVRVNYNFIITNKQGRRFTRFQFRDVRQVKNGLIYGKLHNGKDVVINMRGQNILDGDLSYVQKMSTDGDIQKIETVENLYTLNLNGELLKKEKKENIFKQ